MVSYVLPEAVMNVKTHMPIRKKIVSGSSMRYLAYVGNAFDKVQCPCVIMQLERTDLPMDCKGMIVNDGNREFVISSDRVITPECFSFGTTDEEQQIIEKITNHKDCVYLQNNAIFALGIVTGNNADYISQNKTDKNEMILRGADIYKYKVSETDSYVIFEPESFQQIAPVEYYRAPEKLLYRFISNQLVFAYDDKQTLSLNSCNVVIPTIQNMHIKYIMAILNSRMAQYVFKKRFNSIKVLRSHIEKIPLPKIEAERQEIFIKYTDMLIGERNKDKIEAIYSEVDKKVAELFDITEKEYSVILKSLEKDNLFLY